MKREIRVKTIMKRCLAVFLALVMTSSVLLTTVSAASYGENVLRRIFGLNNYEVKTDCGNDCEIVPTIIIPGISQSNVWLLDENGDYALDANGNKINCFPGVFDIESLLSRLAEPLARSLAAQRDVGLSDAAADAIEEVFAVNATDNNGQPMGNIEVEKYYHSIAECTEEEKEFILRVTPVSDLFERAGEDHVYFFAYNSFGNITDEVDELYEFIQMVKGETGHDKVNLVPISMGATLANGLIDRYAEIHRDLNKIAFVVPALNGSTIVSDILKRELTFLDMNYLYNGFLEELMSESDARLIELILRVLPDEVVQAVVNKVVDRIIDTAVKNSTSMWALCPKEDYPALAKQYLSSSEKREIRRQTDLYYRAQCNSVANLYKLRDKGVQIFDIVDYDLPLYNVGNSWNTENGDGIIPLRSTSMGAFSANAGETLPAGYKQQNTNCSDPTHNHISPDNVVDASVGAFPDTTFYFKGQNHATTGWDDIIMSLATDIIMLDTIEDVYSDPNYPQFNIGRETAELRNELLPIAREIDPSTLSTEDAAELAAAIAAADDMLSRTIGVEGEAEAVTARLRSILEKIGVVEPVNEGMPSDIVREISLWFFRIAGSNGYTEIPGIVFGDILDALGGLLGNQGETPSEPETEPEPPFETETEPTTDEIKEPVTDTDIPSTDTKIPAIVIIAVSVIAASGLTVTAVYTVRRKREEA
ncbi:MAG: hypothetical protein J1F23_05620 [Oscillospiraceae bacterium]|nr:hypothetical protein [Oscillospiraceae bacterium]